MSIVNLSATEIGEKIKVKEISIEESLKDFYENIEKNKKENFVSLNMEEAFARAKDLQKELSKGEKLHPFFGVPIAIKDNISTENIRTSCGSKIIENYISPYNASCIEKLLKAGMIIVGKTKMPEFSLANKEEEILSGAASAIENKEIPIALESDFQGQTSYLCYRYNLTGIRASYGRVSRYGLASMTSSLEQVTSLGKNIKDNIYLLNLISGQDRKDSTSLQTNQISLDKASIKGMKIGLPKDYLDLCDSKTKEKLEQVIDLLSENGALIKEISLGFRDYTSEVHQVISAVEASSNLGRYDGIRYGNQIESKDLESLYKESRGKGFGIGVKKEIILGSLLLREENYKQYYLKALKIRRQIKEKFDEVFDYFDLLIMPLDRSSSKTNIKYASLISLAGLPNLTTCYETFKDEDKISLQFTSKSLDEDKIIKAAYICEKEMEAK